MTADEVPTFSECVIGFRAWLADGEDRLWPISDHRRPWQPGINTARCNCSGAGTLRFEWTTLNGRRVLERAPEHEAPGAHCECGLYSWRRPHPRWADDARCTALPRIVGAVACWGAVRVHSVGFRAQHSCVVTLTHADDAAPAAIDVAQAIATRYRVDLVALGDLERAASRHGTPLPAELRPPEPTAARTEPLPAPEPPDPAPDATSGEVGMAVPVDFEGRPLKHSGFGFGGGWR